VFVLTPLLQRPRKWFLAGLELPGREAVYSLPDKRRRRAVTERGQIVRELS
jgi:hypothetical protein